jgi:hypothetical protein
MGVLFCGSPAGAALLEATCALIMVPSGMPHRGLDMFTRRMCLVAASDEAAGLMGTEPLAMDLCVPLGCYGLVTSATVAYASLPSVD